MRYPASILAVYILALAVLPCSDAPDVQEPSGREVLLVANMGFPCGQHDHESTDYCSPLCVCHCCHVHFSFPTVDQPDPLPGYFFAANTFYTNPLSVSSIDELFRPPRV